MQQSHRDRHNISRRLVGFTCAAARSGWHGWLENRWTHSIAAAKNILSVAHATRNFAEWVYVGEKDRLVRRTVAFLGCLLVMNRRACQVAATSPTPPMDAGRQGGSALAGAQMSRFRRLRQPSTRSNIEVDSSRAVPQCWSRRQRKRWGCVWTTRLARRVNTHTVYTVYRQVIYIISRHVATHPGPCVKHSSCKATDCAVRISVSSAVVL